MSEVDDDGVYKNFEPTFPSMSAEDILLKTPPEKRWRIYKAYPCLKAKLTPAELRKQEQEERDNFSWLEQLCAWR